MISIWYILFDMTFKQWICCFFSHIKFVQNHDLIICIIFIILLFFIIETIQLCLRNFPGHFRDHMCRVSDSASKM